MNYSKAFGMCGAVLVTAASIIITAAPIHARSPEPVTVLGHRSDIVTRHVSYADLNLTLAADRSTLKGRVGFAVDDVCNEAVGYAGRWEFNGCTYAAWTNVRPQMANAVQRAREIALTGKSSIAAAAITINLSHP